MGMVCDKKTKAKSTGCSQYKDAIASCGSTTTALVSSSATTSPLAVASVQVNNSCIKCPNTLLTYSGILNVGTITTAETITISLNKSFYPNCCCNCAGNPNAITIKQFTIAVPTTASGVAIPFTFQQCDVQGQNCGCYDSNCAAYTVTAISSAATSVVTITGLSFTALTVDSTGCNCNSNCNCNNNCRC